MPARKAARCSAPLIPQPELAALVHSRQRTTMHGRPKLPYFAMKRVVEVGPEGGREFLSFLFFGGGTKILFSCRVVRIPFSFLEKVMVVQLIFAMCLLQFGYSVHFC